MVGFRRLPEHVLKNWRANVGARRLTRSAFKSAAACIPARSKLPRTKCGASPFISPRVSRRSRGLARCWSREPSRIWSPGRVSILTSEEDTCSRAYKSRRTSTRYRIDAPHRRQTSGRPRWRRSARESRRSLIVQGQRKAAARRSFRLRRHPNFNNRLPHYFHGHHPLRPLNVDSRRRSNVDSSRPVSANSGHSPTACGTGEGPFRDIPLSVLGAKRACSSPVWTTQLGAHVPFASKASRPECAKSKPWRIEKMGRPRLVESFLGSGER
jgi:hypothetical protein